MKVRIGDKVKIIKNIGVIGYKEGEVIATNKENRDKFDRLKEYKIYFQDMGMDDWFSKDEFELK